jgi:hypothetical protein
MAALEVKLVNPSKIQARLEKLPQSQQDSSPASGGTNDRGSGRLKGRAREAENLNTSYERKVARVTGLEPATSGVTGRRSNQLSYTRLLAPWGRARGA